MRKLQIVPMLAVAAGLIFTAAPRAQAQVSINIGPEPSCPYGYYDYAPYQCAPYGYYGPEWFSGGVFIGSGPWYHGRRDFHGHVDNHYDPRHGYHGDFPRNGERADRRDFHDFHGSDMRDGHGGHDDGDHRH